MINWDAVGAIAETLGAIGVVATLLYLARQFRQSLLDADADANIQLSREYLNHQGLVISDENIGAFVKGLESYSSLSPGDRVKFSVCATGYVNVVEATLMLIEAGRAHDELEMQKQYLSTRLFSYPGFEEYWQLSEKSGFGKATQDWIDQQIEANRGGARFWHQ